MSQCNVDLALKRIVAFAASQGWSKTHLARQVGLQDTTLRKFGREDWNPTVRVLRRLEQVIPPNFCPDRAE